MRQRALKIHPFARLLPVADGEDYTRLREDIRKQGVKVPVVLFDGRILDGRTRYKVATALGIPCPTTEFHGSAASALALVASFNLHRRHLSASQKAVVAANIAKELRSVEGVTAEEAKETATKVTGASNGYFEKAGRIIERRPEEAREILEGHKTIGEVYGRSMITCPRCHFQWGGSRERAARV